MFGSIFKIFMVNASGYSMEEVKNTMEKSHLNFNLLKSNLKSNNSHFHCKCNAGIALFFHADPKKKKLFDTNVFRFQTLFISSNDSKYVVMCIITFLMNNEIVIFIYFFIFSHFIPF